MSQGGPAEAASQAAAAALRDSTPEPEAEAGKRTRGASPEPPRKRRAAMHCVDLLAMDVYALHRCVVGGARPASPTAAKRALDEVACMYITRDGCVAVHVRAGAAPTGELAACAPPAGAEVLLYRARKHTADGVAECAELLRGMSAAEFDALFLDGDWDEAVALLDASRAPVEPGPAPAADD